MANELVPGYPAIADTSSPQAVFPEALKLGAATVAGLASGTFTIGGTPTTGDAAIATINGHNVSVNPTTGQTVAQVATNLAAAIVADGTDGPLVTAVAVSAVITVTAKASGSAGMLSIAGSATGGHTTVTAGSTELDLANGVVIPTHTFSWLVGNQNMAFYQGIPEIVDAGTKAALRAAGKIF